MQLMLEEWGWNLADAGSNLIARVETATAPPPRVPQKPRPFD
jgi:hypothetical protein